MTLSALELEKRDEPLWFCLRTGPKQEKLGATGLRQLEQVDVFAPQIRFRKATKRGPVWFVEALFPSYIFARFYYPGMHRHVRSLRGVSGIVAFGDRVAVIDESTMDRLKEATGSKEEVVFDPEVAPGDSVRIAQGPFSGLETVVTRLMGSKERVFVLMDFLGRQVEVEVPAQRVISTISAREAHL